MNKLLFLLAFISFSAIAADPTETPAVMSEWSGEEKVNQPINHFKSHWLSTINFEAMKYEMPLDFSGAKKSFKDHDQQLLGGRLSFGREIYLGGGFMTTTMVEGYFQGSTFTSEKTANPNYDVKYASYQYAGQVYGADVSQSLSYIFEVRTRDPIFRQMTYFTMEPFIEVGAGVARAFNKVDYSYDTTGSANPDGIKETYRDTFSDQLLNSRIGAGVRMTSRQGYFLFLRLTQNRYDITKRKEEGYKQQNGSSTRDSISQSTTSAKMDPVTIFSFGGGYKF